MQRLNLFSPYVPGNDGPWDAPAATHLLRRAGLGAGPQEIENAVKDGVEAAVEALFAPSQEQEAGFQDLFKRISGTLLNNDVGQLQTWWCYRMLQTRTPLREKMTLFWHGHFATSYKKVENPALIHRQCETLRKHAFGNFGDLVLAVCRDPAMLVYLDGEANAKEHPNENFARELMELFTIGIGNYSEKDVHEAARAFTGWHRDGLQFNFNAEAHDNGIKRFLGRTGHFDGSDIVDILVQQPVLPRFIARKLLVFFACPEPPDEIVAEAAELFVRVRLSVKWFLRDLFLSKFFYSAVCRRTRITSPVEFVIGTCRSLGARVPAAELPERLTAMAQELFAPPNVKGWDGEKKWINATTLPARAAFAQRIGELDKPDGFSPSLDLEPLVPSHVADPDKVVDRLVQRLLDGKLDRARRAEVARFLVTNEEKPEPEQFRNDADFRVQKVRATLTVILSSPEYQMC